MDRCHIVLQTAVLCNRPQECLRTHGTHRTLHKTFPAKTHQQILQSLGRRKPTQVTADNRSVWKGLYSRTHRRNRIHKVRKDLTETVMDGFEKELTINPRNEKYRHRKKIKNLKVYDKMFLIFDPVILVLEIHPKETVWNYVHKFMCTNVRCRIICNRKPGSTPNVQ